MGGTRQPGSGGTTTLVTDSRGQSNTLAIALVMVLALTGALLITGIGSVTLGEGKQVAETQEAVRAMTELDSRASLVALEGGDAATIPFQGRGTNHVTVRETGRIKLLVRNNSSTQVLENSTLGAVVYRNGKERIAYQGGGVWRGTAGTDRSIMVSPPEVHYSGGTLTLPMIRVVGSERGVSTARIEKVGTERVYPIPSKGANWSNPVPRGNELELVIQSDYYRGWAAFFEQRIGADVAVFDGNRTVHVELVSPKYDFELGSGLISVGASSPIDMRGTAAAPTFLDSYDSSVAPYDEKHGRNGTVQSPGGVNLNGNSYIKGNVDTGGTLQLKSKDATVYGNASHQGLFKNRHATITGWEAQNGSGVDIPPIDGAVTKRVNDLCPSASRIPDNMTLTAGEYCHPGGLTLENGETLTINLSDGNVSLAIDGDITLKQNSEIQVVRPAADRSARVWLGGSQVDLTGAAVTVPGDRSPAFRLYGKSGTSVSMTGSARYVGLLFAPSKPGSGGGLTMQKSDLFGSAVVGQVRMESGSAVHYDRALSGYSFQRRTVPAARLSYLHVTINEILVEER